MNSAPCTHPHTHIRTLLSTCMIITCCQQSHTRTATQTTQKTQTTRSPNLNKPIRIQSVYDLTTQPLSMIQTSLYISLSLNMFYSFLPTPHAHLPALKFILSPLHSNCSSSYRINRYYIVVRSSNVVLIGVCI